MSHCSMVLQGRKLWLTASQRQSLLFLTFINSQFSLKKGHSPRSSCPISWEPVLLNHIKSPLTINFISMLKIIIKIIIQDPTPSLPFSKKCKKCCLKAVRLGFVHHAR